MLKLRYNALPTDAVRAIRAGRPDAHGLVAERHVASESGFMCRHCLGDIVVGATNLIVAWRPFPSLQPYAEVGPLFLCVDDCPRHDPEAGMPAKFLEWDGVLLKGYGDDDRIIYGTGQIVAPAELDRAADGLFAQRDVSYLHVRSARNNCYQCRIDSATEPG